jgi:hypothetical protein
MVLRDAASLPRPVALVYSHPIRVLRPRPSARSRALHLARPGHTDVGLARRHYPNQGAFHRLDSNLAAGEDQSRARSYTCTDQSSTLVACREPLQPRQRSGGRFKLPRSPRPAFRRAARPRRRCFSSMSATDPQNEHPSEDSIPEYALSRPPTLRPSGASPRTQVELRLTATLQLQPPSLIVSRDRRGRGLDRMHERDIARSWRALRSAGPPAMSPWPRRCRPLTGLAT